MNYICDREENRELDGSCKLTINLSVSLTFVIMENLRGVSRNGGYRGTGIGRFPGIVGTPGVFK